jgi:predicted acylesterase/phospholipase RssA
MVGWTVAGNRPRFELVTGVSTGALIAPFAFLGSGYDRKLQYLFTATSADDVFSERAITSVIFDDALADTTPLWNMISGVVDDQMVADIAAEYRKGRLLFIGTTDLDAQRPCLWNIGAIAASGRPGAADLIRKVLRASSAVPGAFEPVLIDVSVGAKTFQEMHVDGGAIAQMFLYPQSVALRDQPYRRRTAYLIRNGRNDPEWANVERRTMSIAGRAISTVLKYSGQSDSLRLYSTAQRDGIDFNLAYIDGDFFAPHVSSFDKAYMNALFDYAYRQAREGYRWRKGPVVFRDSQE